MTTKPPPKLYNPKIAHFTRLKNPRYLLYTLRELSGLFISIYVFLLVYQLSQLIWGPSAYQGITITLQSPAFLAFDVIVLLFALLHAITWIDLNTIVIPPIKIGKMRIKRSMLLAGGLLLWLVVSGIVAILILSA